MSTAIWAILGITAFSALLAVGGFRLWKHMDRVEGDVRYRRRWLLVGALIYVVGAVNGIFQVASGEASAKLLLGLPIPLLIAGWFLRQARNINVPENKSSNNE